MHFLIRPFCRLPLIYFSAFMSFIALLVLSNGPAYAEWVEIGKNESGVIGYAGPDTIRRKGDLVKMWTLYDSKTIKNKAGDSFLSMKVQLEYDCAEERSRLLAYTWFSGNMGKGEVVKSDSAEGKWEPVVPQTLTEGMWKFVCGKK